MQRQILELHYKVDQLYRIIEGLSNKLELLLKDSKQTPVSNYTSYKKQKTTQKNKHKDILDDHDSGQEHYQKSELEELLSPDVQIQRLTAQLTASYHRIAALEEQLLAVRSKI